MLKDHIGARTSGLLFCTSTGAQLLQTNTLHVKGGFNIFRRFRITRLNKSDCPDALKHFWSGHAHTHISERYTKLLQERDFRLEWAEKIGMGFELPAPSTGKLGKLLGSGKRVKSYLVDEKGFEPSASSLRTRKNLS